MKTQVKIFLILFFVWIQNVAATPAGLTYQGRLIKNSLPVESSSVTLTLRVTSPGANPCVLFEETHTLNMTNSDGLFTVKIGAGIRTANDKSFSLTQVFSNTGNPISSLTCTGGATSYTSTATDSRNVYVSFDDGVDTVAFSSPYVIQSVPYALEAERLSGKSSSDFVQVTTNTTQTKINDLMVPATYTELLALLNGTTSQYAKTGSGSFTSSVNLNSNKITSLGNPTAATDAANKQYVDGSVGGKTADTTTLSALGVGDSGKVLSWTGTQWTASTASGDSTKLPLAGGTMTGPIAMGGQNLTGLGYINQNAGRYFQIGSFDDSGESTLAGALLSSHRGATWYNTTSNELKYWNGSVVKTMGTSFANQTANQIFAGPGTGGAAAPGFRSLVEADIPQLTVANKVANSATTATSANTASAIVSRDASGNFIASDITANNSIYKDSGTNTVTLKAPTTVTTSYVLKLPATTVAGDAGKVLSTDAAGQLSWVAMSSGTSTLTSGYLFVGNGSNVATGVAASGDVTLANTGAFTVTKIRGSSVSATTPSASGQVLRYDGTSAYAPGFLTLADIRSNVTPGNTMFPATSCTAGQTMTWSSLTDTMTCSSIAIGDSQITYASQTANKFLASPSSGSGAPVFRGIAAADLPITGASGIVVNGGNSFGAASSIGNNDAYDLSLRTNNTNRVTIQSGGQVGIGTASPASLLHVSGSDTTGVGILATVENTASTGLPYAGFIMKTNGANQGVFLGGATANNGYGIVNGVTFGPGSSSQDIGFRVGNAIGGTATGPAVIIKSSGNVGIGTNSPSFPLDVAGSTIRVASSADSSVVLAMTSGKAGILSAGANGAGFNFDNSGKFAIGSSTRANINAGTYSGTDLLTVLASGNVGVGTTTPAEKLEVNGAIKLGITTNSNAGTIRWDGTNFQGYTGSAWTNFVPNPPSSGACDTTTNFTTAGTYAYTVPATFGFITIRVWGGGGAGGTANNSTGSLAGGQSSIASRGLFAGGGGAGASAGGGVTATVFGAGGIASGGTVNQNGSDGQAAAGSNSGAGGNGANGGAGGVSVGGASNGVAGGTPGGGGSGAANGTANSRAAGGGGGAYTEKTYTTSTLAPGTYISDIVVGAAGAPAGSGGAGGVGRVSIVCSSSGPAPANNRGIVFVDTSTHSTASSFVYDSSGRVGIGIAAPTQTLDVVGDIKTSGCLYYASSSLGTCASDERIKKDVRRFDLGLDSLLGLKPVKFKYNGLGGFPVDEKDQLGFIAQDVEKTAPELVKRKMVPLHEDDQEKSEIKVVDYGAVTYVVINSIKDLYKKWTEENRKKDREIASIKLENATLKKQLEMQQKQFEEQLKKAQDESKMRTDKQDQEIKAIKKKLGL